MIPDPLFTALHDYGWAAVLLLFFIDKVWPFFRDKVFPSMQVDKQALRDKIHELDMRQLEIDARQVEATEKIAEAMAKLTLAVEISNERLVQMQKVVTSLRERTQPTKRSGSD